MSEEVRRPEVELKLHPFPSIYDQGMYTRVAPLACPCCLAKDNLYNTMKTKVFSFYFCPGDQPPEYECDHGLFGGGKQKHHTLCAGMLEKHFHVKCNCCELVFFLDMPKEAQYGKSSNS